MKPPCWLIVTIFTIVIVFLIVLRPPWGSSEKGVTIVLSTTSSEPINKRRVDLRRSTGADHVRWVNETGQLITITFTDWDKGRWPFVEAPMAEIVIPAGDRSQWFTLSPSASMGYGYQTHPELDSDAPDEPVISAGD